MSNQDFAHRRLASVQLCQVYDTSDPTGYRSEYRSPDFDADHFEILTDDARQTRSSNKGSGVQVSISTLGLRPYLIHTVRHIAQAIRRDFVGHQPANLPKIVVLSNGTADRSALDQFVSEFIPRAASDVEVALVTTQEPNKSNAQNLLHQHATRCSHRVLINLDDDIRLSPGALSALHRELADGRPKFVGLPTVPIQRGKAGPVDRDIFNMIVAKRRLMGWPAPIGRINALTTSIFPTITNFEAGDDVFLSAFFFINRIPQYVISGPPITYNPPSSLFEYVRRTFRIRDSDRRIVELLPIEWRLPYLQDIIRPAPLQSASADDARWLALSKKLLSYAEGADLFSGRAPTLEETDLSSKDGQQEASKNDNEIELELELARLKVMLCLN